MVRTKRTARKSTRGRSIGGLKKVPQEKIRQVSFMDEVPVKIKDKNAFKRRDTVVIPQILTRIFRLILILRIF